MAYRLVAWHRFPSNEAFDPFPFFASGLIAWLESNPGADDGSGFGSGTAPEQFAHPRISNAWFPPSSATPGALTGSAEFRQRRTGFQVRAEQ
jgi:hypothetical protein